MATVLFVCLHNAGPSQMSAALFKARPKAATSRCRRAAKPIVHAGFTREVVEVMRELSIHLSEERPRRLSQALAERADGVVTMGGGATPARSFRGGASSTGSSRTRRGSPPRRCRDA